MEEGEIECVYGSDSYCAKKGVKILPTFFHQRFRQQHVERSITTAVELIIRGEDDDPKQASEEGGDEDRAQDFRLPESLRLRKS